MKHGLPLILFCCLMSLAWSQPAPEEPTFLTVPVNQTLYFQCRNEMNLLGLEPRVLDQVVSGEVEGGRFILEDAEDGKAVLVPTIRNFQLTALPTRQGDNLPVVPLEYRVVKPPRPTLEVWVNGKKASLASPIPRDAEISIRVLPHPEFARKFPQDARYLLTSVKLIGGYSCMNQNIGKFDRQETDLSNQLTFRLPASVGNVGAGAKFYLVIDKVCRVNFEDQRLEEKFSQRDLMIGFVVR